MREQVEIHTNSHKEEKPGRQRKSGQSQVDSQDKHQLNAHNDNVVPKSHSEQLNYNFHFTLHGTAAEPQPPDPDPEPNPTNPIPIAT